MAPINHNVPGYKNMKPAGLTLQNHPESLTPHAHAQKLGRGSTHGPVGGRGRLRGGLGGVPARARTARAHDTALTPARLSRRRPRPRPHTTVHSLPSARSPLAHTVALRMIFCNLTTKRPIRIALITYGPRPRQTSGPRSFGPRPVRRGEMRAAYKVTK